MSDRPGVLDGAVAPVEQTRLFGHQAAEAFLDIAEREPLRCRVIDATRDQAEIAEQILAIVDPLLPFVPRGYRTKPETVS